MTFFVLGKSDAAQTLRQTLRNKGMAVSEASPTWSKWPVNRRLLNVEDADKDGPVQVFVGRTLDDWETRVIESLVNIGLPVLVQTIETTTIVVKVPSVHAEAASIGLYRAMTS